MKDQLLDIEIRLMVLRHGRQKVLSGLARLTEQTAQELDDQLKVLGEKLPTERKKKPKPSLVDIAALECRDRGDIAEIIRSLALAFENRSFLPNLRDVHRFLDRAGASKKFQSRATAGPTVIQALCKLPQDELTSLASQRSSDGESDYSILSRAIMGGSSDDREKKK